MKILMNRCFAGICCLLLAACGREKKQIQEQENAGLTVQVAPVNNPGAPSGYRFKLNLTPQAAAGLSEATRSSLLYRMDSCFYKQAEGKKVYADIVQFVASGAGKTFEYLVVFADEPAAPADEELVYEDHYLDKKKFAFKP